MLPAGVTLWDTAGAERYAALTANYFRGAHGVVLGEGLYELAQLLSFDTLASASQLLLACSDLVRVLYVNLVRL
jgi:GTPase SAR1 family protein